MGSWGLAVVAAVVIVFAAGSRRVERSFVTPAMFFVVAGVVIGSDVLGLVDLQVEGHVFRSLTELTLTLVLFSDASRVDLGALRREYAVPTRLLGIGLPLTIVVGAAIAAGLLGVLTFPEALVLAVVLAPTDAALGQAVVTDERLPSSIRQGLNVESGLNDGICVPLLFIVLAIAEADSGGMSTHGAISLVLREIGYGVVGGVVAGVVGALLVRAAVRHRLAEPVWLRLLPAACAALAYGLAIGLGGSGFIAAFVGGLTFGSLRGAGARELSSFIEESGELFGALTFLLFGVAFVVPFLRDLTWEIGLYAVLSLTVIRMAPVAVALAGRGERAATKAFVGWFGPRGLASIVFGAILVEDADLPHTRTILVAVAATVVLSVFAHGLSARLLVDHYVARLLPNPT
jgi:NhaP-type Na+/H+ or K+/H+ antiporter